LLRELGSGSYASVYSASRSSGSAFAIHRGLAGGKIEEGTIDEVVAVKIIDLRTQGEDGDAAKAERRREKVLEEISMLQLLAGQPHVVGYIEAFIEAGLAYIVMEQCDVTLQDALNSLPKVNEMSLKRAFREMLSGLAWVHSAEVVHCDIKPDNFVCRGQDLSVKLCDFGFAARLPSGGKDMLTGLHGTPPYMSPEMLWGRGFDMKADTWSMGVIMYGLLLGEYPYVPSEMSAEAMKATIMSGIPAPNFKSWPGAPVSKHANHLIRLLLTRSPELRLGAPGALQHPFFLSKPLGYPLKLLEENDNHRMVLQQAAHVGFFFDQRDVAGERKRRMHFDLHLASLQERYRVSHLRPEIDATKSESSTYLGSMDGLSTCRSFSKGSSLTLTTSRSPSNARSPSKMCVDAPHE